MAEWHGTYVTEAERFRLSDRAMKLYEVLCGIALSRRSVGRLDLTYAQLQRRLGVAEVEMVEADGSAAVDEWGEPLRVLDPDWGQGIRTLQRTLRELAAAEFVSIGYVSNRDCGGHRLCVQLSGPDWFLAKVHAAADLGRAKGGRISRPRAAPRPRPAHPALGIASPPVRSAMDSAWWNAPMGCASPATTLPTRRLEPARRASSGAPPPHHWLGQPPDAPVSATRSES